MYESLVARSAMIEKLDPTSSAVFHRRPGETFPIFVRGEGCYLYDENGRQYLDLSSGTAWSSSLGLGRADLADVLAAQARQLAYVHNGWASTRPQEEFAACLVKQAPESINRAMFVSGGSEANELALRITRQFHLSEDRRERWKIISLEHSYHGATIGALSMTGVVHVNRFVTTDYDPYLIDFPKIPAPSLYRGPFAELDPEQAGQVAAEHLVSQIELEGPETVAAFIVEPVMGNAGMTVCPPGYLRRIREICDQYGILLILDEIMTGAGRTGTFLCCEQFGIEPDLITMGKSISGGHFPLGVVLIHDRVATSLVKDKRPLDHVHTFSGHPVACAVGLKVLEILESDNLVHQVRVRGEFMRRQLRERLADLSCFGEVRGLGLALALEYVADRDTRQAYPAQADVSRSLWAGMLERGYILPTDRYLDSDLLGDFSVFCPAFIITEQQIIETIDALRDTIEHLIPAWD